MSVVGDDKKGHGCDGVKVLVAMGQCRGGECRWKGCVEGNMKITKKLMKERKRVLP